MAVRLRSDPRRRRRAAVPEARRTTTIRFEADRYVHADVLCRAFSPQVAEER